MVTGTIKAIRSDDGYGFIVADDGKEFFFHKSGTDAFDDLEEGDKVIFEVATPQPVKGPRAMDVRRAA